MSLSLDRLEPVLTCEHGGNQIPAEYASLFKSAKAELMSHLGYDIGALDLARVIASTLGAPLYFSTVSRLLVDLNRSRDNASLFSSFTSNLSDRVKRDIVARFYIPYRSQVEAAIADRIHDQSSVLHLSIHSFTPVLGSHLREADIGVLFDPSRSQEASYSKRLLRALGDEFPHLRVKENYPYQGVDDGFTAHLRTNFSASSYLGLEIEVNQALTENEPKWQSTMLGIAAVLQRSM